MSSTDTPFDEYAHHYDAWFLDNRIVLQSEVTGSCCSRKYCF